MNKTIVAIIYDFDNTLSTKDMQEFTFIPSLGITADEFWAQCDKTSHEYSMDHILAYMYLMAKMSKQSGVPLSADKLREMGKGVEFFDGVKEWFARINNFGASLGLEVRHYIISCGLKAMIEGCDIAHEFYNIFACDYVYDQNGEPVWPSVAINYTSKTQFLYRINKGVEDVGEHKKLNMYMPKNQRVVPFCNMIYVGDGLTDVPSMKLARQRGGYAIGVYRNPEDASYLVDEERVDFYVKSDYTENSQMDEAMKAILQKICAQTRFWQLSEKSVKNNQ
ncbi:MAG TPA: haloacid dehalogenase-like hydrolase [Candidatus Fimimonas gallinarum]|uniref:Haloacid dehalogenase-like hydrolase n=1 Tax=Candidatus Fimimonas gallinarum TaxID=2840821 RepID=A0A9D1E3T8_9BACT|nr:haloacid dehalogenase-like hydrolase [Candidatus Fimimonas gallinarum]